MQTALPFAQKFWVKTVLVPLAKKAQFKKGPKGIFKSPWSLSHGHLLENPFH
jgi:hypothetical protein